MTKNFSFRLFPARGFSEVEANLRRGKSPTASFLEKVGQTGRCPSNGGTSSGMSHLSGESQTLARGSNGVEANLRWAKRPTASFLEKVGQARRCPSNGGTSSGMSHLSGESETFPGGSNEVEANLRREKSPTASFLEKVGQTGRCPSNGGTS